MKKAIITIALTLLITNILAVFAVTEKERSDINEFLDEVGNDRTKFEIFLAFADAKGYNFYGEKEIKEKIEANARKFKVLLMPYTGIKGINKQELDKEILKEIGIQSLKELAQKPINITKFWPVIIILVSLIIIIYVLELYRKEKIRKMRK